MKVNIVLRGQSLLYQPEPSVYFGVPLTCICQDSHEVLPLLPCQEKRKQEKTTAESSVWDWLVQLAQKDPWRKITLWKWTIAFLKAFYGLPWPRNKPALHKTAFCQRASVVRHSCSPRVSTTTRQWTLALSLNKTHFKLYSSVCIIVSVLQQPWFHTGCHQN